MQLIIKGDFEVLKNYKLILDLYAMLPKMLTMINDTQSVEEKKELVFFGTGTYLSKYKVKSIFNEKTNILTLKIF